MCTLVSLILASGYVPVYSAIQLVARPVQNCFPWPVYAISVNNPLNVDRFNLRACNFKSFPEGIPQTLKYCDALHARFCLHSNNLILIGLIKCSKTASTITHA